MSGISCHSLTQDWGEVMTQSTDFSLHDTLGSRLADTE